MLYKQVSNGYYIGAYGNTVKQDVRQSLYREPEEL